jgi:hypothetical protein
VIVSQCFILSSSFTWSPISICLLPLTSSFIASFFLQVQSTSGGGFTLYCIVLPNWCFSSLHTVVAPFGDFSPVIALLQRLIRIHTCLFIAFNYNPHTIHLSMLSHLDQLDIATVKTISYQSARRMQWDSNTSTAIIDFS